MQSMNAKERTRGRQEGREGKEEGGIVASGDPALQECADGRVPHSRGACCILGNSAEVTPPVLEGYRLQTYDKITHYKGIDFVSGYCSFSEAQQSFFLFHCRLEAQIHPHTAAEEIYFGASYTMSTSTHTGLVYKVIGKPGQIVYL